MRTAGWTRRIRFATCQYIEEKNHIILKGASGSGKTFLACALGNAACRKFKSVRYIRLPELLEELSLSQAAGELKKTLKSFQKVDLLILDEWLIPCLTFQESSKLLELVEFRCSLGVTIFCMQYDTGEWCINPNSEDRSPISEAIMDRIVQSRTGMRSFWEKSGRYGVGYHVTVNEACVDVSGVGMVWCIL